MFQNGTRRRFLVLASGATAALAGCTDSDDDQRQDENVAGGDGESSGEAESDSPTQPQRKIKILQDEFYEERFNFGVKGTLKNQTDESLSYVEVKAFFYDEPNAEGTRLAEGLDNFSDVEAGAKLSFDAMGLDDAEPERIKSYSLQTETSDY